MRSASASISLATSLVRAVAPRDGGRASAGRGGSGAACRRRRARRAGARGLAALAAVDAPADAGAARRRPRVERRRSCLERRTRSRGAAAAPSARHHLAVRSTISGTNRALPPTSSISAPAPAPPAAPPLATRVSVGASTGHRRGDARWKCPRPRGRPSDAIVDLWRRSSRRAHVEAGADHRAHAAAGAAVEHGGVTAAAPTRRAGCVIGGSRSCRRAARSCSMVRRSRRRAIRSARSRPSAARCRA